MFHTGDKIFYPMHGTGTIDGIEEKEILGEVHKYYVLKLSSSKSMNVMLPVSHAEDIGVRIIISSSDADATIEFFLSHEDKPCDESWNKRYRDNIERMKSNNPRDIAVIIKGLLIRKSHKALSSAEKRMVENAKHILISELALAKNVDADTVETMLFSN